MTMAVWPGTFSHLHPRIDAAVRVEHQHPACRSTSSRPRLELVHPADIIEAVERHDLRRDDGGQVLCVVDVHAPPVACDELVAVPGDLDHGTVQQDAPGLDEVRAHGVVQPVGAVHTFLTSQ